MTAPRPELDLVGTWVRVLSLRSRLLAWYDRAKRDLPWRRGTSAYRTLVSELMLQQTRVDVVIPYFERWCALWPDFAALAAADDESVLAAWSGLGYYRRARFLHQTARIVVRDHGGRLPDDPERLQELPGIGPYTAAAIASIAYGRTVAVVDGNVERVICRLLAIQDEPGAERDRVVRECARRLVTGLVGEDPHAQSPPEGLRPGDWNQAMMELGATICLPVAPACPDCPVARSCVANRAGLTAELPKRREKRATVEVVLHAALVRRGDTFLLVRRPEGTLLSGLWELPTTREGEDLAALERRVRDATGRRVRLPAKPSHSFRHTITHRRITVHVHEASIRDRAPHNVSERADGVAWVTRSDLRDFGVSSMTKKAVGGSG
jgi:A/G-specific adenine glycosylase